jgi:uncharacterized tellurite resistance protein B-like protein
MTPTEETWTRIHELALVYLSLAYGTDHALADEEMETIVSMIQGWDRTVAKAGAQEIVLEALVVYLQENASVEVTRTIRSLKTVLTEDERRHALEDVVRIAEADGVLLSSETSLIATLADIWGLRETATRLLAQATATVADEPAWSLLHDMALICIVLAHSADNDLSQQEISATLERLGAWQPEMSNERCKTSYAPQSRPTALSLIVRCSVRRFVASARRCLLFNGSRSWMICSISPVSTASLTKTKRPCCTHSPKDGVWRYASPTPVPAPTDRRLFSERPISVQNPRHRASRASSSN